MSHCAHLHLHRHPHRRFGVLKIIGLVLLGILAGVVLGFLLGWVVMLLWNWLMPTLFGLPTIGYWQAVGLFILCHLLFKGHHSAHHTQHSSPSAGGKGKAHHPPHLDWHSHVAPPSAENETDTPTYQPDDA